MPTRRTMEVVRLRVRLVTIAWLLAAGMSADACERTTATTGSAAAAKPRSLATALPPARPEPTKAQREAIARARRASPIKRDEEVRLFPALAWRDGDAWRVEIHGWIYEPEADDPLRNGTVAGLREALDDDPRVHGELFAQRVRPFLYDNERDKRISVELAHEVFEMPPSSKGGHFATTVSVPADRADRLADGGALTMRALTPPGDERSFTAEARLVAPRGLTIISDIDDTVKVTGVTDKKTCLTNTFLAPFVAVEGMAGRYRGWLEGQPGGHLHFVSSSPWQLYPDLRVMLDDAGFPAATFSLKALRLKSLEVGDLFADPMTTKPPAIAEIIDRFPERRFALVGDSGEKDPEVYAAIVRRYAERIAFVAIRDVTGEDGAAPRYAEAFDGVAVPWVVFTDPATLPAAIAIAP